MAPLEPWGSWGADSAKSEKVEEQGGLRVLTMIQYGLKDRAHGFIQTSIEPSLVIGNGRTGIYMVVNDHYQLAKPDDAPDAREMVELLEERFESSLSRSEDIIDQVMALKS